MFAVPANIRDRPRVVHIGVGWISIVTEVRAEADQRFDTAGSPQSVNALAAEHAGREDVFRAAVAKLLKAELIAARATAQAVLLKDRHGRRCAERLCFVQDEIIRILFDAATRHLYRSPIPSRAERMAVVATGGYGRGLMAPESDIDLLFILPYKQTAWGEQVAEAVLYCLWDMGLKVGHATRSVDESIRQARGDMTIRTAILETRFLTGDQPLYDELVARFDREVVQGTAAEFVTAKLAEREERHRRAGQSRYLVEPNVKDGKGGLRDLHTLFWIANMSTASATPTSCSNAAYSTRTSTALSAAAPISCGRSAATCTFSPAAPKSDCHSTCSARSRSGWATLRIPACRMSNAS